MKVKVKAQQVSAGYLRIRDVKIGDPFIFEEPGCLRNIEPKSACLKTAHNAYFNFDDAASYVIVDAYQHVTLLDAEVIVNGRVK